MNKRDYELDALRRIIKILRGFSPKARLRIMKFVEDRCFEEQQAFDKVVSAPARMALQAANAEPSE